MKRKRKLCPQIHELYLGIYRRCLDDEGHVGDCTILGTDAERYHVSQKGYEDHPPILIQEEY